MATSPPYTANLHFEKKVVIQNNGSTKAYSHRVNYDPKTLQWCLRRLNETDSGTYKFTVTKDDTIVADGVHVLLVEGKVVLC